MKRLFSLFLAIVLVISASVVQFAPVNAVTTDMVEEVESLEVNDTTTETEATTETQSVADENSIAPLAEGEETGSDAVPTETVPYAEAPAAVTIPSGLSSWEENDQYDLPTFGEYSLDVDTVMSTTVVVRDGFSLKLYASKNVTLTRDYNFKNGPLFEVEPGGTLEIIAADGAAVTIDGNHAANNEQGVAVTAPLIALTRGNGENLGHMNLTNVHLQAVHVEKHSTYTAADGTTGWGYNAGGIHISGQREYVVLNNCKFDRFDSGNIDNNYTTVPTDFSSSAVYVDANFRATNSEVGLTFNNTSFTNCTSTNGAAITTNSSFATVYVNGCTFQNCMVDGTFVEADKVASADESKTGMGGAIFGTAGTVGNPTKIVINSIGKDDKTLFTGNKAKYGGAIYTKGSITIANGTEISGNSTYKPGNKTEKVLIKSDINNNQLFMVPAKAEVKYGGGGVYLTGEAKIIGSTIKTNEAEGSGGGIYSSKKLEIYNSVISDNKLGGVAELNITNTGASDVETVNGQAKPSSSAEIHGVQAYDYRGGGLYLEGSATVSNTAVYNNSARHSGGGIAVKNGTFELNGTTTVYNNRTEIQTPTAHDGWTSGHGSGGGIHVGDDSETVNTSLTINGNNVIIGAADADYNGLNIVKDSHDLDLPADDEGNKSVYGAGIAVTAGAALTMNGGIVAMNVASHAEDTGNGWGATGSGGGIWASGAVTVDNALIDDNYAADFGGGIYMESVSTEESNPNKLTVKNSTVSDNIIYQYSGVGICTSGTGGYVELELENTNITGNKQDYEYATSGVGGGVGIGILVDMTKTAYKTKAKITGGEIANNATYSDGGGIYVHVDAELTVDGTTISNNEGHDNGAGIFANRDSQLTIKNATISANSITKSLTGTKTVSNATYYGAGVYTASHTPEISNTQIYSNTGAVNGGGVYVSGSVKTYPDNIDYIPEALISNNTNIYSHSATDGAGIYNAGTLYVGKAPTDTVEDVISATIYGNTATTGGGGIYNEGTLSLYKAIVGDSNPTDNITGLGNKAESTHGGGIYNTGTLTLSNTAVNSNTAEYSGAGIFNYDGILNVYNDSVISYNTAGSGGYGGGIYNSGTLNIGQAPVDATENTESIPEIVGGQVYKNTALYGGGIHNIGSATLYKATIGDPDLTDTVDLGNIATSATTTAYGGGIYNTGTLSTNTCDISNNETKTDGGGIYTTVAFTDTNSTISKNSANEGGGIKTVFTTGTMNLTGTIITYNIATNAGAGFMCYASQGCTSEINITNATFDYNDCTSGGGGGAYIAHVKKLNITGSSISNNEVSQSGGGLLLASNPSVEIINSNIDYNVSEATGDKGYESFTGGGGIYIDGQTWSGAHSIANITGGSISHNSAYNGGGILICKMVTLTTSANNSCTAITNNIAACAGGGVWMNSDDPAYDCIYTLKLGVYNGETNVTGLHDNIAGGDDVTNASYKADDFCCAFNSGSNTDYNSKNYGYWTLPLQKKKLTDFSDAYWYYDYVVTNGSYYRFRNLDKDPIVAYSDKTSSDSEITSGWATNVTLSNETGTFKFTCNVIDTLDNEKYTEDYAEYKYFICDADGNPVDLTAYYSINGANYVAYNSTNGISLKNGDSVVINNISTENSYKILEKSDVTYVKDVTCVSNNTDVSLKDTPAAYCGVLDYVSSTTTEKTYKLAKRSEELVFDFTNIVYAANLKLNYYPRKSVNNQPAEMDTESTYTEEKFVGAKFIEALGENPSLDNTFKSMIENVGIWADKTYGIKNLIDDYKLYGSQADAMKSVSEYPYPGTDKKYSDILTTADFTYHTDSGGNPIENNTVKWVTYKNSTGEIEPTYNYTSGIDTFTSSDVGAVTEINVWLFNTPKEYTVNVYNNYDNQTLTKCDHSASSYYEGDPLKLTFYYNQRFGGKMEDNSDEENANQNTSTTHLENYGLGGYYTDKKYDIVAAETVKDAEGNTLQFQYWAYDSEGTEIASTDLAYRNRVTKSTNLYAIYAKAEFEKIGLSISEMESDIYSDSIKLNSFINPYNVENDDPNLTRVASIYILCKGNDVTAEQKIAMRSALAAYFKANPLAKLALGNATITESLKVEEIEKFIANYINYEVDKNGVITDPKFEVILTNENRIHFSTVVSKNMVKGNSMLTFAAMQYSDETIVSDNCIEYNFSASGEISNVESDYENPSDTAEGDGDNMDW